MEYFIVLCLAIHHSKQLEIEGYHCFLFSTSFRKIMRYLQSIYLLTTIPISLPPKCCLFPNHTITGLYRVECEHFAVTGRSNHANHGDEAFHPYVRVCQNTHFGYSLEGASEWLRCKAPKDEGAGSVLKYMTKPKSDSNAADWLL